MAFAQSSLPARLGLLSGGRGNVAVAGEERLSTFH